MFRNWAQNREFTKQNGIESTKTDLRVNVHLYLSYSEGVTASQGEKDGLFGKHSWQTWFTIRIKMNWIANTAFKSRLWI